jgi:hypothetical protein
MRQHIRTLDKTILYLRIILINIEAPTWVPAASEESAVMTHRVWYVSTTKMALFITLFAAVTIASAPMRAADQPAFLGNIHRHMTRASTVTDNGDLNPYAVIVAPASLGKIQKDDVLVDNFNDISNLQGTGTTIIIYRPGTRRTTLFAKLPHDLAQCPGGVGLTTAMTMLKTGWVIVGSTPSKDGTTHTKGDGCLLVLGPDGQLAAVWAGSNINGPWGNMATIDNGSTATLFVSMAGFDVPGPEVLDPASRAPHIINKGTVLRLQLSISPGKPPVIASETVVASGFGEQADPGVFLIGPTGLALGADHTLYVTDSVANRIVAIADAVTRTSSAGTGRLVTQGGMLHRPLTLVRTPQGTLLACNALNGQVVEIEPKTGKQLHAQWINTDQAQSPPGSGDLFGLALTPDGKGIYYVHDDVNALMEGTP